MKTLVFRHAVNDLAAWQEEFAAGSLDRARMGVLAIRIRNMGNAVAVELDFLDKTDADFFLARLREDWSQASSPLDVDARIIDRVTRAGARRDEFRRLHESGCFVIPNPWDAGSARLLEGLGFKALATTSSGIAWSLGHQDNMTTLDDCLRQLVTICQATRLPVNADFEGAFVVKAEMVGDRVRQAASTGIAGISLEDSTGDREKPLHDFTLSVERVRAAAEALRGTGVLFTARTEGFIVGRPDLEETIRRLRAFADAGADCLYAPGLRTREEIRAVVEAVAPKPVNVLVGSGFTSLAELEAMGVRRISVGGALARAAWTGFLAAAREIADKGTFEHLGEAVPFAEMQRLMSVSAPSSEG